MKRIFILFVLMMMILVPFAFAEQTEKTEEPEGFTVEHDEQYEATKLHIWNFLEEKGYKVQTIIGTPNIGRYEDLDTTDNSVPWYAYVQFKGEWTEFIVLVEDGEVVFIRPNK